MRLRAVRTAVGEATPESLGWIRILACSALLASALWEDLASSAWLPPELRRPHGVMQWLYALPGFDRFLASETALRAFNWMTALALLAAAVGWRTRIAVPLGAACYLVLGGILRDYAWFFHTGIVPLYVMAVLSLTPCGDAWSVDRRLAARRGEPVVPAGYASAVYAWSRYACWVAIAVPYLAAGLSKIRNGGAFWWSAANMRHMLYQTSLTPMEFDWRLSLSLAAAPDVVFDLLGLSALVVELAFVSVLFSRTARLVLPIVMAATHVGIFFLQNILFLDLIVLQLAFFEPARLAALFTRRPPAATAERAPRWSWGYPATALGVAIVLVSSWAWRVGYYPLTSMGMFSTTDASGSVEYLRALATDESGAIRRAPFEAAIGATADSRYRHALGLAFRPETAPVCEKFLLAAAEAYNTRARPGTRITRFEIQKRRWDFAADPRDPEYGRVVDRYVLDVRDAERSRRDASRPSPFAR
jgi:hypothetical protein